METIIDVLLDADDRDPIRFCGEGDQDTIEIDKRAVRDMFKEYYSLPKGNKKI